MNLLSKLSLSLCAAFLAGMIFSGCGTTEEPTFSDNPNPAAMTGTSTNDVPSLPAPAAVFQPGETVTISSSTGSDTYPGPIGGAGQPYLIADDGTIALPLVGKIKAGGKTPGELQDDITKLYVPQYYVRLTVTVTAPQRFYYVGGEVQKPGPEVYIGETTVSKAIQAAGDFNQFANHKKVLLKRNDGTQIYVNVDKALKDASQDPEVYPGDQIYVNHRYF